MSTPSDRRLILDATLDRSVIEGTLTAATGDRRPFHGWIELTTAIEAMLAGAAAGAPAGAPADDAGKPDGSS
jgi:hypothetical protein